MGALFIRIFGSKTGGIVASIVLVIGIIVFTMLWMLGRSSHKDGINKTIKLKGGTVQQIIEVKLEESPFIVTMESRSGTRGDYDNTFYKIIYKINGVNHIAWFRGVNGPFVQNRETTDFSGLVIQENAENKSLIKEFGERWIFEE